MIADPGDDSDQSDRCGHVVYTRSPYLALSATLGGPGLSRQ